MITELREDGNDIIGKAKIMDSPFGNIVENFIKDGVQLGVSSRGMGSLKKKNGVNEVQNDFYLATAADIVADPSAPDAFVQGIMEGVEWVYENGVFKQQELEEAKAQVDKSSRQDREAIKMQVFNRFINNLRI